MTASQEIPLLDTLISLPPHPSVTPDGGIAPCEKHAAKTMHPPQLQTPLCSSDSLGQSQLETGFKIGSLALIVRQGTGMIECMAPVSA